MCLQPLPPFQTIAFLSPEDHVPCPSQRFGLGDGILEGRLAVVQLVPWGGRERNSEAGFPMDLFFIMRQQKSVGLGAKLSTIGDLCLRPDAVCALAVSRQASDRGWGSGQALPRLHPHATFPYSPSVCHILHFSSQPKLPETDQT